MVDFFSFLPNFFSFFIDLFKILINYLCILLCINCKDKCIDDNDEINNNEVINDEIKSPTPLLKKSKHPILEAYENKILNNINNNS